MKEKSDIPFIDHILESIYAIGEFSKGLTKEELSSNRLKQSAIVREIEIIGEAVKNVSKELKDKNKDIKWADIVGTRDKMIHHYFGIDLSIVWNIICIDIPILKEKIQGILKEADSAK